MVFRVTSFFEKNRGRLLALMAIVGVAFLIWVDAHRPPGPGPLAEGAPLPDATLPVLGRAAPLHLADLKGKPAVLDFWATWCPPCRESLPHLNQLAEQYASRVSFYAVDASQEDTIGAISRARQELGLTAIPIATGGAAYADRIRIDGLPTTIILDKTGRVAVSFTGLTSEDRIAAALNKLL